MKRTTHYDNLKVSRNAPAEVIRAAYKALALKHHPDTNPNSPDSARIMKIINSAYEVLSDPQRRAEYDLQLKEEETGKHYSEPPKNSQAKKEEPSPTDKPSKVKQYIGMAIFLAAMQFIFHDNNTPPLTQSAPMAAASKSYPPEEFVADLQNATGAIPQLITASDLASCIFETAQSYVIPPAVLLGILNTEGGRIGQEAPFGKFSTNIGPLQINSRWIPALAEYWKVEPGHAYSMVRDDACVNIGVGAWILRQQINKTGNLYKSIANFSSAARHLEVISGDEQYMSRVKAAMQKYSMVKSPHDLLTPAKVNKKSSRDITQKIQVPYQIRLDNAERYCEEHLNAKMGTALVNNCVTSRMK